MVVGFWFSSAFSPLCARAGYPIALPYLWEEDHGLGGLWWRLTFPSSEGMRGRERVRYVLQESMDL